MIRKPKPSSPIPADLRGRGLPEISGVLLSARIDAPAILAWRNCYSFFRWAPEASPETAALHLGFHLFSIGVASPAHPPWSDYLVHVEAVRLILDRRYAVLRDLPIGVRFIAEPSVEALRGDLHACYRRHAPDAVVEPIAAAAMLATLGCAAGCDAEVIAGLVEAGVLETRRTAPVSPRDAIDALDLWADANKDEISEVQQALARRDVHFPQMKLVDLYFRLRSRAQTGGSEKVFSETGCGFSEALRCSGRESNHV